MLSRHAPTTLLAALFLCALPCSAQTDPPVSAAAPSPPAAGSYQPPTLSLESLATSDKAVSDAVAAYAQSGDSATFRATIQSAAVRGNAGAQLFLATQYIPEQCDFDPDRDVPNCRPNSKRQPKVLIPTNPLDLAPSYEEASQWLEQASAKGSGEASELLAQLITRMLSNGHPTPYTAADSTRLHALARTQGFDVEPISVSCYQLTPSGGALTLAGAQRRRLTAGAPPLQPFSTQELQSLQAAGAHGTLQFAGSMTSTESALLSRPAGPPVYIRIILDHNPEKEIHLHLPAHHDVIFLQQGDTFVTLPPNAPILPRALSVSPQTEDDQQVSIFIQQMSGSYTGASCAHF